MKVELKQIFEACKHHDPDAQGSLYEQFAPLLMGIGLRYTHSREDAEDLLHDAFIKIFAEIKNVRQVEKLQSWMCRVMVATSVDFLRKRSNLNSLDDVPAGTKEPYEDPLDTDPFELSDVFMALRQLPDNYRLVFNMREVEEMEYEDIAEFTGLSEEAVRVTLFRARKMLRRFLAQK